MSQRGAAWWTLLCVLGFDAAACQSEPPPEVRVEARFGVLFGDQIQERQSFSNIVDQSKQAQVLRIEFVTPLVRTTKITWEVDRPERRSTVLRSGERRSGEPTDPRGQRRVVETGTATLEAGRLRFDQSMPFRPGDPPGRWFIRARVDERLVLDRAIDVTDVSDAPPPDGGGPI